MDCAREGRLAVGRERVKGWKLILAMDRANRTRVEDCLKDADSVGLMDCLKKIQQTVVMASVKDKAWEKAMDRQKELKIADELEMSNDKIWGTNWGFETDNL